MELVCPPQNKCTNTKCTFEWHICKGTKHRKGGKGTPLENDMFGGKEGYRNKVCIECIKKYKETRTKDYYKAKYERNLEKFRELNRIF